MARLFRSFTGSGLCGTGSLGANAPLPLDLTPGMSRGNNLEAGADGFGVNTGFSTATASAGGSSVNLKECLPLFAPVTGADAVGDSPPNPPSKDALKKNPPLEVGVGSQKGLARTSL